MGGVRAVLLGVPLLLAACADFDGTSYAQVVSADEVEFAEQLPDGYFIIGEVTGQAWRRTEGYGSDPCNGLFDLEARAERRMRRKAAKNGGELLIGSDCRGRIEEGEDLDGNYQQTCDMECSAEVARRLDRD